MEEVKYTIDMAQNVILLGHPELDRPFEFYCKDTLYENYRDFQEKNGYEYNRVSGVFTASKDLIGKIGAEELNYRRKETLDALIKPKASRLIAETNGSVQ